MIRKRSQAFTLPLLLLLLASPSAAQEPCFTAEARARAERSAKVYQEPDPGYDPVLGHNPEKGARVGAPKVDEAGLAAPINCVANTKPEKGSGTTPKFHCSVPGVVDADGDLVRYKVKPHFKGQARDRRNGEIYGEFLSSRFSRALGFFADDEWVADVTCPDCQKSLTGSFQGASFQPFQPAAGVELPLGKGIDVKCSDKDSAPIAATLQKLLQGGAPRAEIDAFKLWLAFIDHGDTKTDNHKITCLKWTKNADNTLACDEGQAVFYVSDMGSTFGYSSSTTAKSVGDESVGEAGRQLLATGLQRLLDAEKSGGLITKVFRASRNHERDQPAEAWVAEFERKARTIIDARCSN